MQIKDGFKHSCKLFKKIDVIKNINIMSCLGKANLIHQKKKIPKHNITYLDGKLNKLAYCSSFERFKSLFPCMVSSWSNPKSKIMNFGFKLFKKKNEYLPMTWFIAFFFFWRIDMVHSIKV